MARIPDHIIEEILGKTDAVLVIGERVRLVRKGTRWLGLCPFHGERTPSFSVDGGRGLFYCFGCHKGGTVVDFLMEMDKISYREAIEELAQMVHVEIPRDEGIDPGEDRERASLFELHDRLAKSFHWLLTSRPEGSHALSVLRERGLPPAVIDDFSLGYAPADPSWLFRFLETKGYSLEFLAHSGLFSARHARYPIFTDRIMFPIRDQRSRTIAFGGRLLGTEGPKYLNSSETAIFRKQESLFGLDRAIPAIKTTRTALICEGYMDALSFHAAGIGHAVAPLGTAFTAGQAKLLSRWCDILVLCFDSDEAGQTATEKACVTTAMAGLESRIVLKTQAKDASEILEKDGPEALHKTADSTISGGDFLIRRARERFDITTAEGKSKAISFLFPYIGALDSEVRKTAFLNEAAQIFGTNPGPLLDDYERGRSKVPSRSRPAVQEGTRAPEHSALRSSDAVLMTALALNPSAFEAVRALFSAEDLEDSRARMIFDVLCAALDDGDVSLAALLGRIDDPSVRGLLTATAASGEFDANADRMIRDGAVAIRRRSLVRRKEAILASLAVFSKKGAAVAGNDAPSGSAPASRSDTSGMPAGLDASASADSVAFSETDLLAEIQDLDREIWKLDARNPALKGEGR